MVRVLTFLLGLGLAGATVVFAQMSRYPGDMLWLFLVLLSLALCAIAWHAAWHSVTRSMVVLVNAFAIGFALLAADVYLGYRSWRLETAQFEQAKDASERRTPLQIAADYRTKGVLAVPSLYPRLLSSDSSLRNVLKLSDGGLLPLGGIGNRLTILCTEAGEVVSYESDEHGFNNPAAAWTGRAKFILLGDSFTQGFCVPSGLSFADQIRSQLGRAINLGAAGNGPLSSLAGLREYGPLIDATDILWFFYEGNDFADLVREIQTPELAQYLTPGFRRMIVSSESELFRLLEDFIVVKMSNLTEPKRPEISIGLRDVFLLRHLRRPFGIAFNDEFSVLRDSLASVIKMLKSEADVTRRKLHVIFLPSFSQLTAPSQLRIEYKKLLQDLVNQVGINWIDVTPHMLAEPSISDLFTIRAGPYRGHYSTLGHRIVAHTVFYAFRNNRNSDRHDGR